MKKLVYKLFIPSLISFLIMSSFVSLAKDKPRPTANGQWQYLVKRGDSNGVGGKMKNPNCPLYVGYFSLDFKKAKPYKDGFWMDKDDIWALVQSDSIYVMGSKSYEERGSYTPEDTNAFCDMPFTKVQGDRAPLRMTRISNNERHLEWYVDFLNGPNRANVIWTVKADYDGANSIKGQLKSHICSGFKKDRRCKVINTANFTAKRIKSIQAASGKPLFAQQASLSTWFRWIVQQFSLRTWNSSTQYGKVRIPAKDTEENSLLNSQHLKSSISAIVPVFAKTVSIDEAQSYAPGVDLSWVKQKCADGQCLCVPTTGNSGAPNVFCGRCKYVNCPDKEGQPAPVTEADLWSQSTPSYCGTCGGRRCDYNGQRCL